MRRMLLGVAMAAWIAPSLATARPANMPTMSTPLPNRFDPGQRVPMHQQPQPLPTDIGSLGNGSNGRSNGDVAGPGKHARIDTSTKGPMNDRDPGNPDSEDVPHSASPRPLR